MPGWNLKEGTLVESKVNEDELWSLFNYVFSDACKKTNTYKFGLIKSICDQIYDLYEEELGYFLPYDKLFSKFAENYWNLVNKYDIKQMSYNGVSEYSKVEIIIKDAVKTYDIPENVLFQSLNDAERLNITKTVTNECKRCVIGALYNDFEGKLYAFNLRGKGLYLGYEAYRFISKYKMEIERLNYYAWARFLEKINDDNALIRVLEKLELATPQRKDLSVYRELLYKEFQEDRCFYCGRKLDKNIHVDHFIPWSFVKNDNLWNFVLSCPRCNVRKSNNLVSQDYLVKIENRNNIIMEESTQSSFIKDEFCGYYPGLLDRMWKYARMSGIRERSDFLEASTELKL
ncbi:HNH endonuclease signature motif containing protein [Diplocloster hominis]|uniref:HNH endonuclease n=1 Tax=Diplocloster hominis TaxID=3079010 RepID=UPI0031BB2665